MFNNSEHIHIEGSVVNNVGRDQINNTTFNVETLHCNGEIATTRTEYDEFEYVKRGRVIPLKEICSMDIASEYRWKNGKYQHRNHKTRTKIYSIELFGQQSKFTAVEYEGEQAHETWEEDFQEFSRNRDPNSWLLYGLNHSNVPMLIFHHDLIPLAHVFTESLWMNLYFCWLKMQMGCSDQQIWMDTNKGVFCAGPSGPETNVIAGLYYERSITVPSTRDMLNTDTIFSFFRQFNSRVLHLTLIYIASWFYKTHSCYHLLHPTFSPKASEEEQLNLQSFFPGLPYEQLRSSLLGLRFDTVYSTSLDAVARWPQEAMQWWWVWLYIGQVDQTSVGELTRFTMCGDKIHVYTNFDEGNTRRESWLSQFPRCIEEGKTEDYFFINPELGLISEHSGEHDGLACFFKLCDGEVPPPIYLFLYPITPMTVSDFTSRTEGRTHFWSLDENGQSEMTEDELEQWSVPRLAPYISYISLVSWDSSIYTTLYDWQVAHGFDPNTTDFAQHIREAELEILRPKEEKSSSWWEAVPESGISAFGF